MNKPKNSINIALHKEVLAAGVNPVAITDGTEDTNAYWDGGVAPSAAIIDLEGCYELTSINLVTYYGGRRYYHYEIYVSDNGLNYTKVIEKNDDIIATAEGITHEIAPIPARYVKINMTYNSANPSVHIVECKAYGMLLTDYIPESHWEMTKENNVGNIALFKRCRANSNQGFAFLCTDGNTNTSWIGEDYPRYVDVDLEENYLIDGIRLYTPATRDFSYTVYSSLDGVDFSKVMKGESKSGGGDMTYFPTPVEARIVRVMITRSSRGPHGCPMISQIKLYGEKTCSKIIPTRKSIEIPTYDQWLYEKCGVDINMLHRENGRYDIKETYREEDTVQALNGLVSRVLGSEQVKNFAFEIQRNPGKYDDNYFVLGEKDGKVNIKGDCGVSCATGLNHYLKKYCNVHVSQQNKQVKMPSLLPMPEEEKVVSPYRVRYAYNYCTLSYTMPYFGYEDWQRELDFLMLSGVNLVLDITATEALWVHYLQKLGYTVDQAKDYVCGYCYKAWWLMGNLEGTGGTVSDSWVKDTLELARVNQRYMTVMGVQPALQTFVGAMPSTFGRLARQHLLSKGFSDVADYMAPQGLWAGGFTRPNVLKTTYDGYHYLAELFYRCQDEIYGQVSDYYCGDVCHEGGIVPADLSKPEMARKILDELMMSNKDGQWILQAWWDNPMKETLDGFGEYKSTNVIILDLAALAKPRWSNTETWGGREFGGCGWIYCILDNYGGRTGMHGKLDSMSKLIAEAKANSSLMRGIGITPEGTFQNPVVFDLFWQMGWSFDSVDIDKWITDYVVRRYGSDNEKAQEAWRIFEKTVYGKESYDGTSKNNAINENASLQKNVYTGPYYKIPYDRAEFEKGVCMLMDCYDELIDSPCYVYDMVDLTRQLLTNSTDDYFEQLKFAVENGDIDLFRRAKAKFIGAMYLIDEICSYSVDDRMSAWEGRIYDFIYDERTGHYDEYSIDMMKINARALLSTWASAPITNYANRQYEGYMVDYCIAMWQKLLNSIEEKMEKGEEITPRDLSLGSVNCFNIGWDMVISDKEYTAPLSDPKGGNGSRGLLAIFNEIRECYLVCEEDLRFDDGKKTRYVSDALIAQGEE